MSYSKEQDRRQAGTIREKITQIRFSEQVKLGEAPIDSAWVLTDMYEQRNVKPIWTGPSAMQRDAYYGIRLHKRR
jgi:hypothetical protein